MTNALLGYTEGVGQAVAVDEVDMGAGVGAVQYFKLVSGNEGSSVVALVDQDRGLLVEPVTRRHRIAVTPTLDAGAYASGDVLFGDTALANASRAGVASGIIRSVAIVDQAEQRAEFDLLFFSDNPAGTYSPASPFAPTGADLALCVGRVPIRAADYQDAFAGAGLSIADKHNLGINYELAGGTLYVLAWLPADTPTYGGNLLTVSVVVQID